MKSTTLFIIWLSALPLLGQTKQSTDPIFPKRHHLNAGIITTYSSISPPPAIIADISYGISNGFSAGLVGGTTGSVALYGLKFNLALIRHDHFRLYMRNMIVYYPERNGCFLFDREWKYSMAWMLSMTVLEAEFRTANNLRYSFGLGLMEDHCEEQLKIWLGKSDRERGLFEWYYDAHASVSIPIRPRLTLRPEVIFVMQDGELIEKETHKIVFPVNPFLNIVFQL